MSTQHRTQLAMDSQHPAQHPGDHTSRKSPRLAWVFGDYSTLEAMPAQLSSKPPTPSPGTCQLRLLETTHSAPLNSELRRRHDLLWLVPGSDSRSLSPGAKTLPHSSSKTVPESSSKTLPQSSSKSIKFSRGDYVAANSKVMHQKSRRVLNFKSVSATLSDISTEKPTRTDLRSTKIIEQFIPLSLTPQRESSFKFGNTSGVTDLRGDPWDESPDGQFLKSALYRSPFTHKTARDDKVVPETSLYMPSQLSASTQKIAKPCSIISDNYLQSDHQLTIVDDQRQSLVNREQQQLIVNKEKQQPQVIETHQVESNYCDSKEVSNHYITNVVKDDMDERNWLSESESESGLDWRPNSLRTVSSVESFGVEQLQECPLADAPDGPQYFPSDGPFTAPPDCSLAVRPAGPSVVIVKEEDRRRSSDHGCLPTQAVLLANPPLSTSGSAPEKHRDGSGGGTQNLCSLFEYRGTKAAQGPVPASSRAAYTAGSTLILSITPHCSMDQQEEPAGIGWTSPASTDSSVLASEAEAVTAESGRTDMAGHGPAEECSPVSPIGDTGLSETITQRTEHAGPEPPRVAPIKHRPPTRAMSRRSSTFRVTDSTKSVVRNTETDEGGDCQTATTQLIEDPLLVKVSKKNRNVGKFTCQPDSLPHAVCFELMGTDVRHNDVKVQVESLLQSWPEVKIVGIQFHHRALINNQKDMNNRWIINTNSIAGRNSLAGQMLTFGGQEVELRLYDEVVNSEYQQFIRMNNFVKMMDSRKILKHVK